jgi:hypothetical protein
VSETIKAQTAFVVVIPEDGAPTYLTTDFGNFEINRVATYADMRRGVADALSDLNARAAAQYVAAALRPEPSETAQSRVAKAVSKKKVQDAVR